MKKLISLGAALPVVCASIAMGVSSAQAVVIGSVDIAGQLTFPGSTFPGGPFAPPEFTFIKPALCLATNNCDYAVTAASGVLASFAASPLSAFNLVDLLPNKTLYLPSSSAIGPGAGLGTCAVNPLIQPNTQTPQFKCAGAGTLDAVAAADPNKQITEALIPTTGSSVPFLTLANNTGTVPYYKISLTKITSFSSQGLTGASAQTAISFDLLWQRFDASGSVLETGDGSINSTFVPTSTGASYSGQLRLNTPIPEPSGILGTLAVVGLGALSLRKKNLSK